MYQLKNKRIILGVTGGIAAYKAAVLLRQLTQHAADVRVVMTRNACEFITPLTMQALSGKPVHIELLDAETESAMGHIDLARWADVVVVAPASANFIARLANGIAEDLLSTLCLATEAPLMVVPAMNQRMWLNEATQSNIGILQERNIVLLGPVSGDQACGEVGPGRMLEPDKIAGQIAESFNTGLLSGSRLLITAGPTREAIDPVRYITNRSSGKMGFAIANAAVEAGADVAIVSGPVSITKPERVTMIDVQSAKDMYQAVMQEINERDIFISAAAVSDYAVESVASEKIKKYDEDMQLALRKTPDILAEVAALECSPFTVGFAAETEDLLNNAKIKLQKKSLDMIAANQVGESIGFDQDENALTVIWQDGQQELAKTSKDKLARALIALIAKQYYEKNSNQTH